MTFTSQLLDKKSPDESSSNVKIKTIKLVFFALVDIIMRVQKTFTVIKPFAFENEQMATPLTKTKIRWLLTTAQQKLEVEVFFSKLLGMFW